MATRPDIAIIKGSNLPTKLIELIAKKNHLTIESQDLHAIIPKIKKLTRPVLLVYSVTSQERTSALANQLVSSPSLKDYPVVFIGKGASKHQRMLSASLQVVEAIEAPYDPIQLYDRIVNLAGYYDQIQVEDIPASSPEPKELIEESARDDKGFDHVKAVSPEEPNESLGALGDDSTNFEDNLHLISSKRKNLKIEDFVIGAKLTVDQLAEIRPSDPRTAALAEECHSKTDDWGRGHIERVAVTSDRMINVLGPQSGFDESARAAVSLYSYSFSTSPQLMKRDYTAEASSDMRATLQAKIRESSGLIEKIDAKAAEIISQVADLVGGELVTSDDLGLIASTIMAADLMDRLCQKDGRWNPHGAYSLIRKIRGGQIKQLHPKVLSCIVVYVTEAVNTEASILLLPKLPRYVRETLRNIRTCKKLPLSESEVALPLCELLPGMKISQPVLAFDGTQLIPAGLVLDQDLISRLWQLCTVKPLLIPLITLTDSPNFFISISGKQELDDRNSSSSI